MTDSFLPPLEAQTAITDEKGRPTLYFQRFMQQLTAGPNIAVNNGVVDVSGVLTYIDGNGDGSVPNPTGWVTGEWRIMPTKDFVVENRNTHVFLEFDPDTYANGVMWGGDAAFAQVWGLGIPSGAGRFQLLGSAAFEFLDTPYVINNKIFHEGNLIFGTGLSYNAGTGVLTATGGGGGTTPTIRAHNAGVYNAASVAVPFPVGTVAGDVVIVYWENGFAVTTAPAGWTTYWIPAIGGTFTNQGCIAKIMTAADILAGSVTVTATGAFNGFWGVVTLVGTTVSIPDKLEHFDSLSSTNIPSAPVVGMFGVSSSDLLFGFASTRSNQIMTVSANMTVVRSAAGANASGIIFTIAPAALGKIGMNETISAPVANNGLDWVTLAFKGP